jgi:peptide/nickel transport system substrate-binding protein
MKRSCLTLLLVPALAIGMTACASTSKNSSTGGSASSSRETLTWATDFAPVDDWAVESDDSSILTQAGVAEALTRAAPDGSLEPSLAASWKRADSLTWDFTLRSGVKFQDGTPLTAQIAASDLNYVLHVTTPAPGLDPKVITSVSAVSTSVVQIKTATPDPLLGFEMASPNAILLAPAAYKNGKIDPEGTGTGPFVMTTQNLPQSVTLAANPDYWGGKVHISKVNLLFVADADTRGAMLRTGEAQLVLDLPVADLSTYKSDASIHVVTEYLQRTTGLYMNEKRAPFNNVKFRQAIQAAIDSTAIAKDVLPGAAIPAPGEFPASAPWAPKGATVVAQDLARAKALLAQAGVDPQKLSVQLTTYTERPELPLVAQAVQGMLEQLGIKVSIKTGLYASISTAFNGNYDMTIMSRGSLFFVADPYSFLQSDYTCQGSFNISAFCDASFDSQLSEAGTLDSASARYKIYATLESEIQSQAVTIALYNEVASDGLSTRLHGYQPDPYQLYYLSAGMSLSN